MKRFFLYDDPLSDSATSVVLFLLRLFVGFLMLTHGWNKVMNFEKLSDTFLDPIGLGSQFALMLSIVAEVGCSVLLILGIFTRLAVLPLIVNMSVAVFVAHRGDPFQTKELAVVYLGIYVLILLLGSGRIAASHAVMSRIRPAPRSVF